MEMFSSLSLAQILTMIFAAIICGMAKGGIQGLTIVATPIMAMMFGAKFSTGVILPMFVVADAIAVYHYGKNANIKEILRLLPTTLVGFIVAAMVAMNMPTEVFQKLMAWTLLIVYIIMLWAEFYPNSQKYVNAWWYSGFFGFFGGFATLIGNVAGPVLTMYLLSKRKEKYEFVGTNACFFFILNFLKLPVHAFLWKNFQVNTFLLGVLMFPFVFLGIFIAIKLVKILPDKIYRRGIQIITGISVLLLFV